MKKIVILLLLFTNSIWSQSFFDTSISFGANKLSRKSEGLGSMEIRYNQKLLFDTYFSVSAKTNLTAKPPQYTGEFYTFLMDIYPRTGLTYQYGKFYITAGASLKPSLQTFWYYPYLRTDFTILNYEETSSSIGIMFDIEEQGFLFGFVFKDIL